MAGLPVEGNNANPDYQAYFLQEPPDVHSQYGNLLFSEEKQESSEYDVGPAQFAYPSLEVGMQLAQAYRDPGD